MFRRFLALKVSIPLAVVLAAGVAYSLLPSQAFTPSSFDDTLNAVMDKRGFRRLGFTANFACGGGCVAARPGGAARRGCVLYIPGGVSGAFRAASDDCAVALLAACTGQAVDDCASGERF